MIAAYTRHLVRMRRAPGTIRLRLFYLNKFDAFFDGDLADAEHDDFDAYIFANEKWSQSTQHVATATIKAFYRWAHREQLIPENPARDLPDIDVHRRPQRIASEEQIAAALEKGNTIDRAMVLLGAECGLRVREITTLNRRDRTGEWLNVIGKGNNQRSVHVSPELLELLEQIEQSTMRDGNYFPGQKAGQPVCVTTAWRRISDVLDSNPHSLRRRAGTIIYRRSGNDIRLTQLFLGHKHASTTELYLNVSVDDLVRAAQFARFAA